jgi:hypothetical protein
MAIRRLGRTLGGTLYRRINDDILSDSQGSPPIVVTLEKPESKEKVLIPRDTIY